MAPMLRLWPRTEFSLPPFELVPLEFEPDAGESLDEPSLEEVVSIDAAAELRQALAELRRSIS